MADKTYRTMSQLAEDRPLKDISLASIPAFPAVALRVLNLVSRDDADFNLLMREIASDAMLSAQVLRLANSALFQFEVGTLQQAVMLLGAQQIQSVVMSAAIVNYSLTVHRTEAFQRCWQHTIATAVLSREIAAAAGTPQPEQSYSLGLLHDIGRLGLLVSWPADYDQMLRRADRDVYSLVELERERFTMDHCELGRLLVQEWKLPNEFCMVAGRHHDLPAGETALDSLRIAQLSCRLADALEFWVAKPFQPLDVEEVLSELPDSVRHRLPNPLELSEKIRRSLDVGTAILNGPPPDSVPILSENTTPETGITEVFLTRSESQTPTSNLSIILIAVIVFTLTLAAMYAFLRSR